MSSKGLSVGEVARRSGIAVSAVHFYERKGLIRSARDGANHRRYAATVLRRIAIIQVAQRLGLSLREIARAMAPLPAEGKIGLEDWEAMSRRWAADLDIRIAQLQRLRDGMTDCIGCGCLSLESCRLRNPDDTLADQGPGPHYLDDPSKTAPTGTGT